MSASIVPVALILLILLVLGCSSAILTRATSTREDGSILFATIRSAGLTSILFALFLVYPSVSRVVFQTFDCVQVGEYSVLRSDVTVSCKSWRYDWMLDLAKAMVALFVIGVPTLQAGLLWYKVDAPFLTKHYLPQYPWFQLQELGAKLLQTTIVVVVFSGSRLLQSVYLLFVTVIALSMVTNMMPYRIYWDNALAAVVQCALSALIGLGLVHSQDKGSRDEVAGLMLFTVSVPFVVAFGLSCLELWRWKKTHAKDGGTSIKTSLTWEEKTALKRIENMLTDKAVHSSTHKSKEVSQTLLKALGSVPERPGDESVPVENDGQVFTGEEEWHLYGDGADAGKESFLETN
jgi:hypothetical protein